MNALVIAQHHGAFLTLQSLLGKVDRIVAFLPQSQLDKYAGFVESPVFLNYGKNMKAFCKKHKIELHIMQPIATNPVTTYLEALRSIDATGVWAVLSAGSIFKSFPDMEDAAVLSTIGRVFDADKRLSMYHMLGLQLRDHTANTSNFFVDIDKVQLGFNDIQLFSGKGFSEMKPMAVARPDVLVGAALSALECIRLRTKSNNSNVLNYWMKSITKQQDDLEPASYPYDEYALLAKTVRRLLPAGTYNVIVENGAAAAEYRSLADLAL